MLSDHNSQSLGNVSTASGLKPGRRSGTGGQVINMLKKPFATMGSNSGVGGIGGIGGGRNRLGSSLNSLGGS